MSALLGALLESVAFASHILPKYSSLILSLIQQAYIEC